MKPEKTSGRIKKFLQGGDLRSTGKVEKLIQEITNQRAFDELILSMQSADRVSAMRAADAIEKLTRDKRDFLLKHKKMILKLALQPQAKEIKWHLALLIPRLKLSYSETGRVWEILRQWALDNDESRIVRVNSLQGLFELSADTPELSHDLILVFRELETQNIPSIKARIRILYKKMKK